MKKPVYLMFIVLFASLLAPCTPSILTPTTAVDKIEPGDRVGDFLITTGKPEDETFVWQMDSTKGEKANEDFVNIDWGKNFNPSIGIYDDTLSGKLDSNWADLSYEMYIEDRPVNLQAFGTIESNHPTVGKMRHWNVVVVADHPGKITVHEVGEYQGKSLEYWTIYTILPPVTAAKDYLQSKTSAQAKLNYLLYLPEEYGKDPQRIWPVILYLHGLYSKGSDLNIIKNEPFAKKLVSQSDFPFIVIAPQGDGEYEFWSEEKMNNALMILLDEIQVGYAVDPKRIYLTGPDFGGNGVWENGLSHPERFAALVPVMGYYDWPAVVPENICDLKDVPVWAFHGAVDKKVPLEAQQILVDALKACGGDVKFTVFPNYGHDIEIPAYNEPGLYDWLMAQAKE